MADDQHYEIPQAHGDRRGELLTQQRARRAGWLRDLLALVPTRDQGDALAAILEVERIETEALIHLGDAWRDTVQCAYQQGRIDGDLETRQRLGLVAPPDEPALIMH